MMLTMGAANGVDPSGQAVAAILILATDPDAAPPEGYTWADAEAAGAGSPASSADASAPAGAGAASAGSTGAGGGSSAAGANSGAAAGSAPGVDSGAAGGGSGAGAAGSAGTGATYTAASDARPAASPALARPRIVSSRVNSRAHTVAFHVDGAGRSARLQCALIRETGAIPASGQFRQCGSRKRYTGLRPGIYDFFVRSFASAVDHSASAERRIEIS
jgi:hypothetical protein